MKVFFFFVKCWLHRECKAEGRIQIASWAINANEEKGEVVNKADRGRVDAVDKCGNGPKCCCLVLSKEASSKRNLNAFCCAVDPIVTFHGP